MPCWSPDKKYVRKNYDNKILNMLFKEIGKSYYSVGYRDFDDKYNQEQIEKQNELFKIICTLCRSLEFTKEQKNLAFWYKSHLEDDIEHNTDEKELEFYKSELERINEVIREHKFEWHFGIPPWLKKLKYSDFELYKDAAKAEGERRFFETDGI